MEHFLENHHEDHPIQNENDHKLSDEKGTSSFEIEEKSTETESTTSTEFPNGRKDTAEEILRSGDESKRSRTVRTTVMDQNQKFNNLSRVA